MITAQKQGTQEQWIEVLLYFQLLSRPPSLLLHPQPEEMSTHDDGDPLNSNACYYLQLYHFWLGI